MNSRRLVLLEHRISFLHPRGVRTTVPGWKNPMLSRYSTGRARSWRQSASFAGSLAMNVKASLTAFLDSRPEQGVLAAQIDRMGGDGVLNEVVLGWWPKGVQLVGAETASGWQGAPHR